MPPGGNISSVVLQRRALQLILMLLEHNVPLTFPDELTDDLASKSPLSMCFEYGYTALYDAILAGIASRPHVEQQEQFRLAVASHNMEIARRFLDLEVNIWALDFADFGSHPLLAFLLIDPRVVEAFGAAYDVYAGMYKVLQPHPPRPNISYRPLSHTFRADKWTSMKQELDRRNELWPR
jgi:hypothetical protein